MANSNDKQNRTKGVIESANTEIPNPMTSKNTPLGNLTNNKDNITIQKESKSNKLF